MFDKKKRGFSYGISRKSDRNFNRSLRFEGLETRALLSATTGDLGDKGAALQVNGGDDPFESATADYLGTSIARTGYDLQPSILYDATNSQRPWQMWWLGQKPNSHPGDRIYYSYSTNGSNWNTPQVVLSPQLGATGHDEADDHLLGSPSVLKIGSKYYMYYEAYGMYATAIQRFYSFTKGDTWTTNGTPWDHLTSDYAHEKALGLAPRLAKTGTHPIYSGQVTYAANGKVNRYLSLSPVSSYTDGYGNRFEPLFDNVPLYYLYDNGGSGRKALYQFWDGTHWNTFVTDDINAEGVPGAVADGNAFHLGYAATSLDSPDMQYCLENRIMLATSSDGVNWTRFDGNGAGNSIVVPRDSTACYFNMSLGYADQHRPSPGDGNYEAEYWDIVRSYGSGFPAALVRDDSIELFFTDDSENFGQLIQWRIRVPLDEATSSSASVAAAAYQAADHPTSGNRDSAFFGEDIAWSPQFGRYFVVGQEVQGADKAPTLVWSAFTTDPATHHYSLFAGSITTENQFAGLLPTNYGDDRMGTRGGLATDGLGHTLDFADHATPHSAYHIYYEAAAAGVIHNHGYLDLDHILVLAYHNDYHIAIADGSVTETDGTDAWLKFNLTLSERQGQPVTVDYETLSQSATVGQDLPYQAGTITFNPGETTKQLSIRISGDLTDEPNETFQIVLSNPQNARIEDDRATGTILDNDPTPSITIQDASGNESAASLGFSVRLSNPSSRTVTVHYGTADGSAVQGQDYNWAGGTLTFAPGVTSLSVNVVLREDNIDEPNETFDVVLSTPQNATIGDARATGTIFDNDPTPSITIQDASGDESAASLGFAVSLSNPSSQTITVHYGTADGSAAQGQDYSSAGGTLTFAPGVTSLPVNVGLLEDKIDEPNETFEVVLSTPQNATIGDARATGTIFDNDPPPTGDLNGDGYVGSFDLDLVRSNWNRTVPAGSLLDGDPSGDGVVGSADLDIVRGMWGMGTPPAAAARAVQVPSATPLIGPLRAPSTDAAFAASADRFAADDLSDSDLASLAEAAWLRELDGLRDRAKKRTEKDARWHMAILED